LCCQSSPSLNARHPSSFADSQTSFHSPAAAYSSPQLSHSNVTNCPSVQLAIIPLAFPLNPQPLPEEEARCPLLHCSQLPEVTISSLFTVPATASLRGETKCHPFKFPPYPPRKMGRWKEISTALRSRPLLPYKPRRTGGQEANPGRAFQNGRYPPSVPA
jgi:hypothetical protein